MSLTELLWKKHEKLVKSEIPFNFTDLKKWIFVRFLEGIASQSFAPKRVILKKVPKFEQISGHSPSKWVVIKQEMAYGTMVGKFRNIFYKKCCFYFFCFKVFNFGKIILSGFCRSYWKLPVFQISCKWRSLELLKAHGTRVWAYFRNNNESISYIYLYWLANKRIYQTYAETRRECNMILKYFLFHFEWVLASFIVFYFSSFWDTFNTFVGAFLGEF